MAREQRQRTPMAVGGALRRGSAWLGRMQRGAYTWTKRYGHRRDPQSLLLIDRAAFFLKTENTIGTRHIRCSTYGHIRLKAECAVAPPPPDGSRGCVATIRRLMQGVGHTVPCNTSRQAALQARWVGWVGT